ncbi:hypothetical protein ACE7GA_14830 [Roseomonas sp. CCTCC AB2023176]|uniref:hypothetical protein n=1 Tax=Roseomonas sp. CCTCC AB2023176 TaxID=3342640 RepID=UPI0035DA2F86
MDLSRFQRRGLLGAGALIAGAVVVRAQTVERGRGQLWFDPTQLPSFSGVVERYLINPEGKTDRLLFREGPQILFPEHVAEEMERTVPTGRSIIVYGIRARRAAAITMLAWAPDNEAPVRFVDRPTWTFPEFRTGGEPLEVEGEVRAPLLSPQGDAIGAILGDYTVIRVPIGVAGALGDRLNAGKRLAAVGQGATVQGKGRALDAERIGEAKDKLQPLPPPVERPG